jgi:hypothetical protein
VNPLVSPGDLVVVLEWAYVHHFPVSHTGRAQTHSTAKRVRVEHPQGYSLGAEMGPGVWAAEWRLPTPEERDAYPLSQLAEAGL